MTKSVCPPVETLEEISRLAQGDPRREHLQSCPQCRARWTALQSFLAGHPVPPGARLDEARTRLGQALRHEAGISGSRPAPGEPRRTSWRGGFWMAWRPAIGLAAACVLIVVGLRVAAPHREPPGVILRGEPEAADALMAPVSTATPGGTIELRWRAFPGAAAYRVTLFRAGLEEIARLDAGRDTTLVLPPPRLAALGPSGSAIFWRVAALREEDLLSLSPPATLRLP
jgi:hypothetical protein